MTRALPLHSFRRFGFQFGLFVFRAQWTCGRWYTGFCYLCFSSLFICIVRVVCVVVNFCAASFTCRFALSLPVAVAVVASVDVVVGVFFRCCCFFCRCRYCCGFHYAVYRCTYEQMYISMQDAPLIVHAFLVNAVALFEKSKSFIWASVQSNFVDYLNGSDDI